MTRAIRSAALCALVALAPSLAGGAATTWREAIASRAYLIGRWSCTFTAGSDGGSYSTTWSKALAGRWLKQSIDQPAQPHASAFKSEYFVGYNEERNRWVRFGAMTTGQYFVIRMTDIPRGWGWQYVGLLGGGNRAPAQQFDATFIRTSDRSYTIAGPTYRNSRGTTVTEHHVCTRTE